MKHREKEGRRQFLTKVLAGLGAVMFSGCDRLSETMWFPRVLSSAEWVNRRLHHLLTSKVSMAREFPESDLSLRFPSNGTRYPVDREYRRLAKQGFRDWTLETSGLIQNPIRLSLADLRALPSRTQVTRHDCVEGWSAIAKWKGALLSELLDKLRPLPGARYVMFFCADPMDGKGAKYYESIDLEDAYHPQTILAYDWNDQPLPIRYGAPLRLRVERQLGYKMAKYVMRIEVVDSFKTLRGGKGGYWEDRGYEWYAGI